MFRQKNLFFLSLLFLAAAFFGVISVGGEFLHERIHAHATQASHDECPVSILQAQVFVAVAVIGTIVCLELVFTIPVFQPAFVFPSQHKYSSPRAPPSLS